LIIEWYIKTGLFATRNSVIGKCPWVLPHGSRRQAETDKTCISSEKEKLREALGAFEKEFISQALAHNHRHRANTAEELDITERTRFTGR